MLPERQAQRMIQQYDEEQILLERRVAELENLVQQDDNQAGGRIPFYRSGQEIPGLRGADRYYALCIHRQD